MSNGARAATGKLTGKVAFITGAGSGIGAATARMMAAEGASVVLAGIPAAGVNTVAQELTEVGLAAIAIPTDVADAQQVEGAIAETVSQFGKLDIVVASAGIQLHDQDVALHQLPESVWDKTHDVNYRGVALTTKYALAQFLRQEEDTPVRGSIVIVASITALSGRSGNVSYLSGKHGLLGLNRYIAVHYGKYGIRCNAISPGALQMTPNHDIHPDPEGREAKLTASIPLGRLGIPEDIAPFITFLATPEASYANGANFVIDGGVSVA